MHKRRQAVEPVIGHLKADHGMNRCWLKGSEGDALHTVLSAAGFNLRWLLRAVARLGLGFVLLILTAWMSAASVLRGLHQRAYGSGHRIFLTGGHQVPAGAAG
jgi:IS5 family transposase